MSASSTLLPLPPSRVRAALACLLLACLSLLGAAAPGTAAAITVAEHPRLLSLVEGMVEQHGFDRAELDALFAGVSLQPSVIEKIRRPAESLPWHRYRNLFLNEDTVNRGVEFMSLHAPILARAQERFGVPPEIIVAIIGVETRYGRVKGSTPVLDSLVTLVLDYPKRANFFAAELEHLLLLCREESLDPTMLLGSYAGAMGIPQFISSSYRRYAVDFNEDGVRDLLNQVDDAIGSVGNYLASYRWQAERPVAVPATLNDPALAPGKGLLLSQTFGEWYEAGVRLENSVDPALKAMLMRFDAGVGNEHWIGFHNFFVITRYNHSKLYAMAVYRLGQMIRQRAAQ